MFSGGSTKWTFGTIITDMQINLSDNSKNLGIKWWHDLTKFHSITIYCDGFRYYFKNESRFFGWLSEQIEDRKNELK